jgi:LPXTG-motif cell wall-anchored protein
MKKFALSKLLALAFALAVVAPTGTPALADAPLVTISGTVVSMVDEVLVLRTDRGNLTFDLDKSTEMPANITVGSQITVSYDSDDDPADRMDARRIVMTPEASPVAPSVTTPAPTPEATPREEVSGSVEDTDTDELPATASPLPLVGAAGLLALAGSFLLRKRSRRT